MSCSALTSLENPHNNTEIECHDLLQQMLSTKLLREKLIDMTGIFKQTSNLSFQNDIVNNPVLSEIAHQIQLLSINEQFFREQLSLFQFTSDDLDRYEQKHGDLWDIERQAFGYLEHEGFYSKFEIA